MIEEKVSTSQEPPEIVKVAFDNLMEELANTLTLEESKKIQDRIQLKEDIKLTNIWFDSGPANTWVQHSWFKESNKHLRYNRHTICVYRS
jgi:hypothetical protein